MKILVDADACPVKNIIASVAEEFSVPAIMFIDTSHELDEKKYTIVTVDKATDSVDLAIINRTKKGDLIITQDYGLAALGLGKKAYAMNFNGLIFTEHNIDRLLFERHLTKKQIRTGTRVTALRKRIKKDDIRFEKALRQLLLKILN